MAPALETGVRLLPAHEGASAADATPDAAILPVLVDATAAGRGRAADVPPGSSHGHASSAIGRLPADAAANQDQLTGVEHHSGQVVLGFGHEQAALDPGAGLGFRLLPTTADAGTGLPLRSVSSGLAGRVPGQAVSAQPVGASSEADLPRSSVRLEQAGAAAPANPAALSAAALLEMDPALAIVLRWRPDDHGVVSDWREEARQRLFDTLTGAFSDLPAVVPAEAWRRPSVSDAPVEWVMAWADEAGDDALSKRRGLIDWNG
jgi:hypothetical protein